MSLKESRNPRVVFPVRHTALFHRDKFRPRAASLSLGWQSGEDSCTGLISNLGAIDQGHQKRQSEGSK